MQSDLLVALGESAEWGSQWERGPGRGSVCLMSTSCPWPVHAYTTVCRGHGGGEGLQGQHICTRPLVHPLPCLIANEDKAFKDTALSGRD